MPNVILAEHDLASTPLTITLADLPSSTAGVGRQSTMVNNELLKQIIHIFVKVTTHATIAVTADTNIFVYFLKGDDPNSSAHRTDGFGASDLGRTIVNARKLGVIRVNAVTANVAYFGEYTVYNPGPEWGIAIVQDTGQLLHTTAGNHHVRWTGENQEIQ